jgi:hypothetical protein
MKAVSLVLFCLVISFFATAQQRLELLQTNIPAAKIKPYGDSYLWTKNWWLTNGMLVPVDKGGNAIAANSRLNKGSIDSLSKVFRQYVSPDIIRFGNLKPRYSFSGDSEVTYYIQSTIIEINGEEVKPLAQFKLIFSKTSHNNMPDVQNIYIIPRDKIKMYSTSSLIDIYNRKATSAEAEITPPEVSRSNQN